MIALTDPQDPARLQTDLEDPQIRQARLLATSRRVLYYAAPYVPKVINQHFRILLISH